MLSGIETRVWADAQDAQSVCRHLGIPLHEADFVAQYWTEVFQDFIAQCARGLTPNPDLACNRHIKFSALLRYARGLGVDAIATGHYVQLRSSEQGAGDVEHRAPCCWCLLDHATLLCLHRTSSSGDCKLALPLAAKLVRGACT